MRDTSLRWGLGMGVLSAAAGTGALLLGALIEPFKHVTTADAVALAVFVRGMLVLISLGLALGLAYYGGLRVARTYFQSLTASADSTETTNTALASLLGSSVLGTSLIRKYAVLAGGLTMFCYWLITSMYIFVLPPTDQTVTPRSNLLNFIETRVLLGVIYVIFGLGLGGLGGRAPAARLLLDRIAPPRQPAALKPAALPVAPAQPTPEVASPSPAAGSSAVLAASTEPVSNAPAAEMPISDM
ncbi:MAG TPA: hypothetical protein VKQ30_13420 [Ktedonobacterales bacterium]|nr:hypothetical protein [Ktedonobacterales bacterium]